MSSTKKDKDGGIFKLYFDLTDKYTNEYGENTIVLLQVGSFYEVYGLKDQDGTFTDSKITEVANACHMNIKPKHLKYDNKDVFMAGFPDKELVIEKFLHHINEIGYTSVMWSQDEKNPTIRGFNKVVSPGTYFSNNDIKISNNISCIWIEITKPSQKKNQIMYCGISNFNNITGDSMLYEYQIIYSKSHTIYDELQRFISIKNPSEVIIISSFTNEEVEKIIQYSNINTNAIHIFNDKEKVINKCSQQIYQHETFEKYFKRDINDDEEIMLKSTALQSLTYLLDFIYKHNPNLIRNINYPTFDNNENDLILANHTLQQLNIIPDNNYKGRVSSLMNLLNYCKTSIGKRKYEYDFTHPTCNIQFLKREYDMTEYLLNDYKTVDFIRNNLNIHDLAYLLRKSIMKKISPLEITFFFKTIQIIQKIYNYIIISNDFSEYISSKIKINIENETQIIIDKILSTYLIEICETIESYDIEENIFIEGYDNVLDDYVNEYKQHWDTMEEIRSGFDSAIKGQEKKPTSNEYVRIENTEKKGYCLITTKTRSGKLTNAISNNSLSTHEDQKCINGTYIDNKYLSKLTFLPSTQNNVIIENPTIKQIFEKINYLKKLIKERVNQLHIEFLDFFKDNQEQFNTIITFVEMIDNIQNKAYVANKYNYSKPQVLSLLSSSSFVSVKDLRHPLIENIHHEEYVTNDLEIGREKSGILLYGTNAVGKTSLIRALGMSVIMAQCGYYVPASHFEYIPYKKIFSRILNNDNLFKGLSTFAVEMSELNVILKYCDENSLILGDELCSGTEMDSAKAIFVSGLETIHEAKSSFMFATHLHEIANYEEIENLNRLSMKHMTVQYDYEKDTLIYDRKLKDGPGESMYGLEVCKSLNMPSNFLEQAYQLRDKYIDTISILDSNKSRYNSKKLVTMCEICKKKPAVETHHKKQQKDANEMGYIGTMHKDHISNLIGICESCHKKEHKNYNNII